MDEAHTTLSELSAQRDQYRSIVEAAEHRIATLETAISEDAAVAHRMKERRTALEQSRSQLDSERSALLERQRKIRQAIATKELDKQRCESTITTRSPARQLREETAAERTRGCAGGRGYSSPASCGR